MFIFSYPQALKFLTFLLSPKFREDLKIQSNAITIHERQYYHWLYHRRGKDIPVNRDQITEETEAESKDVK